MDANQIFAAHDPRFPGMLVSGLSNGRLAGEQCLTARSPNFGGYVSTTTATGETWCLSASSGPQGEFSAVECDPPGTNYTPTSSATGFTLKVDTASFTHTPNTTAVSVQSTREKSYDGSPLQLSNSGRNQFGASGPVPHSKWSSNGGGAFLFDLTTKVGSLLQSTNTETIFDDDNIGGVTKGGDFCLELSSGGALEVWTGPLSNSRRVVVLFNRSPAPDLITVDFALLETDAGDAGPLGATSTFSVYDVWANTQTPVVTGQLTKSVGAHDVALLILCPTPGQDCHLD
jgi:hypothetical protein